MPALLINTSIWPKRWRTRSSFDWKKSWCISRSNGKTRQWSKSNWSSFWSFSSSSSRRAERTRRVVGDKRANCFANSRPMPDEAPGQTEKNEFATFSRISSIYRWSKRLYVRNISRFCHREEITSRRPRRRWRSKERIERPGRNIRASFSETIDRSIDEEEQFFWLNCRWHFF